VFNKSKRKKGRRRGKRWVFRVYLKAGIYSVYIILTDMSKRRTFVFNKIIRRKKGRRNG
jgi:hypothetical protein